MTITLTAVHEQLIARAMETGAYQSADEVVARALEILGLEEERLRADRAFISEKIERALDQFDRGQFFTPEESRAEMKKRKAAWVAGRERV